MSNQRLMRDIESIRNSKDDWHFTVTPDERNIYSLKGTFEGPKDSPYEGGVFVVDFQVPTAYPLKPPKAKFDTRVFHPNISSQTGAICLDILGDNWTPVYKLESILISLQQLLQSPNPSDPQDAEVARLYTSDIDKFNSTAREWTRRYAQPAGGNGNGIDTASIRGLTQEMGFDERDIVRVMQQLNMTRIAKEEDKEKVINALLA